MYGTHPPYTVIFNCCAIDRGCVRACVRCVNYLERAVVDDARFQNDKRIDGRSLVVTWYGPYARGQLP